MNMMTLQRPFISHSCIKRYQFKVNFSSVCCSQGFTYVLFTLLADVISRSPWLAFTSVPRTFKFLKRRLHCSFAQLSLFHVRGFEDYPPLLRPTDYSSTINTPTNLPNRCLVLCSSPRPSSLPGGDRNHSPKTHHIEEATGLFSPCWKPV